MFSSPMLSRAAGLAGGGGEKAARGTGGIWSARTGSGSTTTPGRASPEAPGPNRASPGPPSYWRWRTTSATTGNLPSDPPSGDYVSAAELAKSNTFLAGS